MKRFIVAALGVGAWLRWMRRRRADRPTRAEKPDAEIAAEVRAVVDGIAAPYVESGAVTVEEDPDKPARPRAHGQAPEPERRERLDLGIRRGRG